VAQPLSFTLHRLRTSRVCLHITERCIPAIPIVPYSRSVSDQRNKAETLKAEHCRLRKDVLRLMPSRFEIGPVYTTNPRDRKTLRKSTAFKPLAKELCFDIDLTDYDDIRTCCDKANICKKCWQFITMAIKVVDVALRDDFGFKHIMWVYSGRRGAHAWVCDKKARQMDDTKRRAIAGYLEVIKGGTQSGKKVNLKRPLHPHIAYVHLPHSCLIWKY
jgi:DNA primase small subunit